MSRTGLSHTVVFLLIVPKRFLCCSSYVALLFPYLLRTAACFGASGGLRFMNVAFPRYLNLYVWID